MTEIPTLNGDAVEFQPVQHFSSTKLVAPNPPHRRHRRRPWIAGAAAAILLFALIGLWYAHRPLPRPISLKLSNSRVMFASTGKWLRDRWRTGLP